MQTWQFVLELGLVATVGLVHVSPALTAKESKYSN
jgi:hypothetical protein